MKKIFFNVFVLALTMFFVSTFLYLPTLAQKNDGQGLTISPPLNEVSMDKGESKKYVVKLTNPTRNVVEVYPEVKDFKAKGEGGEPDFYQATDETTKFALSKWISFSKNKIAIAPEQFVKFEYEISVPESAEPGGHYGVMFFASEPPETRKDVSNVSLASMVGSLVLVKVPGNIQEKGTLENFDTNKFFYLNNNVSFNTRVGNLGNIHFKPKGNIEIKSIFGENVETLSVNDAGGNVLPDSTRKFENKWKSDKFLCGIYKANLGLVYGDSAQKIVSSVTFIIIPWWMLIIIAVFLLLLMTLLIILIRKIRRKRKEKNKRNIPPQNPGGSGKVILR